MIAVLALQQHSAPPIMHSRSLNPYVASAFDEWRGAHQNALPLVAKQVAAWPVAPRILAGCSSFGMSGVNAHALFSAPHTLEHADLALTWQRQRHWPVPVYHRMLVAALWDPATATARCA
jgi:acyl transferase domain-containing protein